MWDAKRLADLLRCGWKYGVLATFLARTYLLLIVARGVITLYSMPRITRHLGARMAETPSTPLEMAQDRYAWRVAWAIRKAAPYTPTESNCYPQGLTAWWLLRRKRLPTTVYYGAAFKRDDSPGDGSQPELETHVWVRAGQRIVTGAPAHLKFGVVASYADDLGRN